MWTLVPRPPNTRVITGKWVLKHKLWSDCSLERYKTRWVMTHARFQPTLHDPSLLFVLRRPATTSYLLLYVDDRTSSMRVWALYAHVCSHRFLLRGPIDRLGFHGPERQMKLLLVCCCRSRRLLLLLLAPADYSYMCPLQRILDREGDKMVPCRLLLTVAATRDRTDSHSLMRGQTRGQLLQVATCRAHPRVRKGSGSGDRRIGTSGEKLNGALPAQLF